MSAQERFSRQMVVALDAWRDMAERASERLFTAVYGSPTLQATVGIDPTATAPMRKAPKNPQHRELTALRLEQLKKKIKTGGIREAVIRSALYIGMAKSAADERTFSVVRRLRESNPSIDVLPLPEFKAALREQYYMLLMEPTAAMAALPSMLPADPKIRSKALAGITQVVTAVGSLPPEAERRLQQIKKIFERGPVGTEDGNIFAKAS